VRRIPIDLPPLPGEALDSWLLAYAARLRTPLVDLTAALGMTPQAVRQPAVLVALPRHEPDLHRLVEATGLPADSLEGLWQPLSRYALLVERRFGRRCRIARATRPLLWSRFCQPCLTGTGGRWQAAWRLPWFIACPAHQRLLTSVCPTCAQHQRQRPFQHDLEPQTTRCSATLPGAVGRGDHRCRADLTNGPSTAGLPPLAMAVQNRLNVLLDFTASERLLTEATEDLADLLTVASLTGLDFDSLNHHGLDDTRRIDAGLHRAAQIITDPTGHALAELATADIQTRPRPLPRRWRTASPHLISRVLSIRDPQLPPVDRLRWRTATCGRPPDILDSSLMRRWIPHALWSDWSVRLRPPAGVDPVSFRIVAAAALALPGSTRPVSDLVTGHADDSVAFAQKLSHVLRGVAATDHGAAVLRALTQLSDMLRAHGGPIDYQRRLHIAVTGPLIDLPAWDRICAAAGVPTGGHRKLKHARLWIWETLTAGLPQQAPRELQPTGTSSLNAYHRFTLDLPATVANLLERRARDVLDSHGGGDEPLTWSPPTTWADLNGLPVADLDSLDLGRLQALLRTQRSPTNIAEELNTSLDHVRLIVRRNPQVHRPSRSAATPTAPRNARTLPPPELTTERLGALVEDDKRTLRSLAAEFGVGRNYLVARLRREGIPVPPSNPRPVHVVDPRWLRTEYLERRRTLPDIAAEIGTTAPNIARIARKHGIPLRSRGGASHAASLTTKVDYPDLLTAALLGQGGTQRVRRFQIYARLRSVNKGAAALGVHQCVLVNQLTRLEAACGGQLLTRSTQNQQPQRLTDLGSRLLAQADEHLGPQPDAPPPLPEPLATAQSSFWGEKRLQWFKVAAQSDTLTTAADAIGTDRYTLDRSISGLEQALSGVLLNRASPSQPHQLTTLGRQLLDQMASA
jgi:hypothetical protein